MADFTSALYLGMQHDAAAIAPWASLTTGRPAALFEPAATHAVARQFVDMTGADDAMLYPSTLHAFHDLLSVRPEKSRTVFVDAGAYPISTWAVRGRAVKVPHHAPQALATALARLDPDQEAVFVCDGFCTGCGKKLPLKEYLSVLADRPAQMIVDDTQLLGVGGLRGAGIASEIGGAAWPEGLMTVASTAKAFGVPAAVVSGGHRTIGRLRTQSKVSLHCSPPSAVDIAALHNAMSINARRGAGLRDCLNKRVRHFRDLLFAAGAQPVGNPFPVVTIRMADAARAMQLRRHLATRGITSLARRLCRAGAVGLSFLITVRHSIADLTRAAAAIRLFMEKHHDLQT